MSQSQRYNRPTRLPERWAGTVLRWDGIPSPDGKWIANQDKDNQLWLFEVATKTQKKIDVSTHGDNSIPRRGLWTGFRVIPTPTVRL